MLHRELTNTGKPLIYPNEQVAKREKLTFILVNLETGKPISSFDIEGRSIAGTVEIYTDLNGEFSINLVPNDKLITPTCYLIICKFFTVKAQLESGTGAKQFADFIVGGAPLTPAEVITLSAHINDEVKHLTQLEHQGLTQLLAGGGGGMIINLDGGTAYSGISAFTINGGGAV